jgi:hypothetical protein
MLLYDELKLLDLLVERVWEMNQVTMQYKVQVQCSVCAAVKWAAAALWKDFLRHIVRPRWRVGHRISCLKTLRLSMVELQWWGWAEINPGYGRFLSDK